MENQIRILSTKKLLENQKQLLLSANFAVEEADFINVVNKHFEIKRINDFLIFTSQNAVESVLENKKIAEIKTRKCFCVGEKTRALLEQNGFEVIVSSDYASELASIICNQYFKSSFTFFCGNLRRDILPDSLTLAEVVFEEVEVYETVLTPHKANENLNGILFFSPSGVQSFLKMNVLQDEICFCIGGTTAKSLRSITKKVVIANQPTIESTLIKSIEFFNKI
ncbi:uroporphyrinogen-III synthase [Flavobacterium sp. J49]|uniref:uroporphyrinogen-III synthase n=1 Tax=Flavobacterium sp. J49 TaxID=2718534 RepID=UPI0015940D46|nr:uroporphyrinogen-III synthase [Flavobacterium sp. J49]MBF6641530.1 uroporphyrinogen-III synthase [Flavobacterium sp. J49]NIC02777.1 uroporphyrinogen-III synthase [Flavobacterium sp. J49]